MEKTGTLQAEQSRIQAELAAKRSDFSKELRRLVLVFGLFVLGAVLQIWMKPEAEFSIFVVVLLVGPVGAVLTYVGIRVLMAWNEVRSLKRRLRHTVDLSEDLVGP